MVIYALVACTSRPPAGVGTVQPSVVDGQEDGACFADGTCNAGLECVSGRCATVDEPDEDSGDGDSPSDDEPEQPGEEETERTLLIFHNNMGPMCLDALEWLEGARQENNTLVVEEHLTTVPAEVDLLRELESEHAASEGVSSRFEYLPIIFFEGHAFSGFDDGVAQALQSMLLTADEAEREGVVSTP